MWIFLAKAGFFSVVAHRSEPGMVVVRARARDDLVRLCDLYLPDRAAVLDTPTRDYGFRIVTPKASFATAMQRAAHDIDYPNFKSATAKVLGHERAALYGDVWMTMLALQRGHVPV